MNSRTEGNFTCNLVSLYSLPFTPACAAAEGAALAAADELAVAGAPPPGMYSRPSLIAFSLAAFSARSRLSASIFALMAARALASSIFSEHRVVEIVSVQAMCTRSGFTLLLLFSLPICLLQLHVLKGCTTILGPE